MEERRLRAADLFRRGVIPAEIARQLGVTHQVVSEWRKAWRAWSSRVTVGGPPAKLSRAQLAKVEKALAKGAEAHGYVSDLWTLSRVAEVIERLTGVAYHPGYVWYLLRNHLYWSWQRPARRAVERDDAAIEQWVTQRWPHLKKAPGASTH
jgi:transposase